MLPRRAFFLAALLWATLIPLPAALSAPPKPAPGEYIPVSQIRPGMTGYGLTVFKGTKIERFDVEVLSVLKRAYMGRDLILIRMHGGPITDRGANIIAGMSGSPVYINGKLAGAVSMGYTFPKEPVAMVTPIEDMFDALDPNLPSKPMMASEWPIPAGNQASGWASAAAPPGSDMALRPLITPVEVSGLSPRWFDRLRQHFGPMGSRFVVGPGPVSGKAPTADQIQPGSAFSVGLIVGDIEMAMTGTVTYRKGNTVLLLGHPMGILSGELGAVDFPLLSAVINDVFAGMQESFKLASQGPVVGAVTMERPWGCAGVIGKKPKLIPVTITVNDHTTGRSRTYHCETVSHPYLSPFFVTIAAGEAIYEMHSFVGDAMAKVRLEVNADGLPPIVRENTFFASLFLDAMATDDLAEIVQRLYMNQFGPVPVKSVNMTVDLQPGRHTIRVERIFLDKDRVEPGETVKVGVVLRPWRQEPFVRTLELKVPANAPSGRTSLVVYGGSTNVSAPPVTGTAGLTTMPSISGPAETSVAQIVRRFLERDRNDDLVAKLYLNTPSVNVFGEKLLNLPAPVASVMASPKSTGFRSERAEVKSTARMDSLVEGVQILPITIQRKILNDGTSPGQPTSPSTPPSPPSTLQQSRPGSASVLDGEPDDGSDDEMSRMPALETGDLLMAANAPAPSRPGRQPSTPPTRPGAPQPGAPAPSAPSPSTSAPSPSSPQDPGRRAVIWTQKTKADFQKGELHGTGVTTDGDLRIAPSMAIATSLPQDTYVWAVLPDGKGNLYLGTGNYGRIYRLTKDGKLELVYDSPELEIHALAMDKAGNLYAGSSPNGIVYKITPDGKASELFKTGEHYVFALATDADGNIYAGTGSHGKLFKISPNGQGELFLDSRESHILSLAVDKGGSVIAGTSDNGLVLRVTKAGLRTVLYDTSNTAVTAVAVAPNGDIYVGTGPRGQIIRVPANGSNPKVLQTTGSSVFGIVANDHHIYAVSGTNAYAVADDDTVVELHNDGQDQLLCLADDGDALYAGSGNSAAVYKASLAATRGTYESGVHDAGGLARWGRVRWQALVPKGTSLKVETRTGNSSEPDGSWSPWSPAYSASDDPIASPPARFIQYRVTMESSSPAVTPALKSIGISYLPANHPPTVAFTSPSVGDTISGTKTITWTASDSDRDALTYELYYSSDNGATWQRMKDVEQKAEERPATPPSKPETPSQPKPSGPKQPVPSAAEVMAQVNQELANDPTLSPEDRKLLESVLPAVVNEALSSAEPQPATGPVAAPKQEPPKPMTVTTYKWDTTQVPDGEYLLKIVASDKRSNPTGYLTDEQVLGPIVVVNDKPKLFLYKSSTKQNGDGSYALEGVATSKKLTIAAISYRVDNGDWAAAAAEDGLFDSPEEPFTITTDALSAGNHTIEIRATDSAGNSSTEKIPVTVK